MFTPFGNHATNTSAVWHPEPRGRGTFNVLSSCLTTMILCVWTSVHLNIPGHNDGMKQSLLRKPGWLLLALLAPEIVAWNAWEQRRVAQELTDDLVKAFGPGRSSPSILRFLRLGRPCLDPEQGSSSESHSRITLTHGFYAAMGGYAIRSHALDGQYPVDGQARLTLTKYGIQWILLHAKNVFPDLTEAEILDKSKASTLVKTLTCLQAFWFCLQCILRLTMNTSISLLELNVFGHCTCTFIIYAIWWNKPLDVSEPTLLKVEDEPELECLLAVLYSYNSRTLPRLPHPLAGCAETGYKYSTWGSFEIDDSDRPRFACGFETRFSASGPPVRSKDKRVWRDHVLDADDNEKQVDKCAGLHLEQLKQLFNLDASLPQIKISLYEAVSTSKVRLTIGSERTGLTYYLSRTKLEQLNLKNEESEQLKNLGLISGKPKETQEDCYRLERSFFMWLDLEYHQEPRHFTASPWDRTSPRPFLDRIHDWTFRLNSKESLKPHLWFLDPNELVNHVEDLFKEWVIDRISEWLAMSAAAFVYGGLHLLAWSAPFHAPVNELLWKISGITTASLVALTLIILLFLVVFEHFTYRLNFNLLKCLQFIVMMLTFFSMISFILLYVFARVYLVVESFLSIAYLPESVLVTPNFSLYFPHIG